MILHGVTKLAHQDDLLVVGDTGQQKQHTAVDAQRIPRAWRTENPQSLLPRDRSITVLYKVNVSISVDQSHLELARNQIYFDATK